MSQIKLDYLSVAKVSGEDAGSFLQAQLTSDLTQLADGNAGFSAFCQPSGNVIANVLVFKRKPDYFLIASAELFEGLVGEMSRFILRAKVRIDRLEYPVCGCMPENGCSAPSCFSTAVAGLSYCLDPEFDGSGDSDSSGTDRWRAEELRSGVVWLNPKTSGQFLPQMLGLERLGALSFRKGCFPGQEVIARVRYLGKLKRRPVVLSVETQLDAETGGELELLHGDGQSARGVIVDLADHGGITTVFCVARIPQDCKVTGILVDGQPLSLVAPAHT